MSGKTTSGDADILAKCAWDRVASAYHWEDGYSDAYLVLKTQIERSYLLGYQDGRGQTLAKERPEVGGSGKFYREPLES